MEAINKKRLTYHQAVKRLFSMENADARLVLRTLVTKCHVLSPTFVEDKPDTTAFREGQRHVILSILSALNKDTDKLLNQIRLLEKENEDTP